MNLEAATSLFAHFPTDWIILIVFAILIAFDAIRSGPGRARALALSLPATLFLSAALEHARILSGVAEQFSSPAMKSALFGVVFVAVYLLVLKMSARYTSNSVEIIQALMAGVAAAAVLVVVWLAVPGLQGIWNLGPPVQGGVGEGYRFWWVVGSYLVLAFVRG